MNRSVRKDINVRMKIYTDVDHSKVKKKKKKIIFTKVNFVGFISYFKLTHVQ